MSSYNHGGSRPGSGRPASGRSTKVCRIPVDYDPQKLIDTFELIEGYYQEYKDNTSPRSYFLKQLLDEWVNLVR